MKPDSPPIVRSLAGKLNVSADTIIRLALGLTDDLSEDDAADIAKMWERAAEVELSEAERTCLETGAGVWRWLEEMTPDA